ncbi:SgcJ/EcaC family oxidoreductase [Mesorhizobium sp. MSK_1335]|uniref:SgcJ/EcaC family oxidoreductase n=1 Tax=Mesorhizobium montanum TaxID=3072323 RepID=A0ABU4ZQ43_9HYPH|nr:SgcJ/EcaC family oxidoreductase [Mesorhizobium sp. MSK_1335]MDX8527526.1 SgcJ/EcaC family oxidoreductase [Mesorhizobium sp. MSK_1335]
MTDDETAIRHVVETWMATSRNGDLDTVLGLMTDDVVFMVPGEEPFGRQAFAAAAMGMGETRIDGTSEIVELRLLGDWAFIRNGDAARWRAGAAVGLYADDFAEGA